MGKVPEQIGACQWETARKVAATVGYCGFVRVGGYHKKYFPDQFYHTLISSAQASKINRTGLNRCAL